MGKIFEALEKATRQNRQKDTSPAKAKGKGTKRPPNNGNVVPFANLKKSIGDLEFESSIVAYHDPQSVEAELFKVLRTNLLFPAKGKAPKSILITSAMPGEGKSFVAANLSISIANGVEEHVLLVDADVRRPSIHEFFGLGQTGGLSDYLMTGTNVSKHFDNPVELLTTQKMKALLHEVSRRYDDRFIIIDSAPSSLASETAAIAKYVDGIIIVVRAGKTPRKAVTEVVEQLGKEKILGIIMNHSDQTLKRYTGYGKSYYAP
ncbi:MAG: exopolysaccharide biosynthesis protein [Candidatus Thiodiazotropha sp.]